MNITKHYEIFKPSEVEGAIAIIGVGAVGSQVAFQLAKLGLTNLNLYDNDCISEHNLANQLYSHDYIDTPKVLALDDILYGVMEEKKSPTLSLNRVRVESRSQLMGERIAFICVDSMASRQKLAQELRFSTVNTAYESRMNSNSGAVYTYCPQNLFEMTDYKECLYCDEDVSTERQACGTIPSIISTATLIASLMVDTFIKRTMRREYPNEIIMDLKELTLTRRKFKRSL